MLGGLVGVAYDVNYHAVSDNVKESEHGLLDSNDQGNCAYDSNLCTEF
jgi:hypothetical protein